MPFFKLFKVGEQLICPLPPLSEPGNHCNTTVAKTKPIKVAGLFDGKELEMRYKVRRGVNDKWRKARANKKIL